MQATWVNPRTISTVAGALIGGGVSAYNQQQATGNIDWFQVGIDGVTGASAGFIAPSLTFTPSTIGNALGTLPTVAIIGGVLGASRNSVTSLYENGKEGSFDLLDTGKDTLKGAFKGAVIGTGATLGWWSGSYVLGSLRPPNNIADSLLIASSFGGGLGAAKLVNW